jgi:hypothetical protein
MANKRAQDNSAKKLMATSVAFLRALHQIHQNAHSGTKTASGNPLLFRRLCKGTQETTKEATSKLISLFGSVPDADEEVKELVQRFRGENFDDNWIAAALKAEQTFQAVAHTVYHQMKKRGALAFGLEDVIMSIAKRHELHIHLLKQTLENDES